MPNLNDFEDYISPLIESQFPNVYKEDGPVFVAFVKAYYEYLEQTDKDLYNLRKMFENIDVDQSVDTFLEHFRKQFLYSFPKSVDQSIPFTIKHIMDLYRSKGTPRAVELFLRMVYGIESTLYNPGRNLMAPSDAEWFIPKYIETVWDYDKDSEFSDYAGKEITGSISGATAIVDSVLKTTVQGKLDYVMFLANINGTFQKNELVSHSTSTYSPKIIGSLTGITLTANGTELSIGDELAVTSSRYGVNGKVLVTNTTSGSGQASYSINDGGFGYSVNTSISNVIFSTTVLKANNFTNSNAEFRAQYSGNNFFTLETLTQPAEIISHDGNTTFNAAGNTSTYVVGTNGTATAANSTTGLANGKVGSFTNTVMTVYCTDGTFGNQIHYYHQSNTIGFEVSEKVSVNSTVYGYLNAANSTVLTINATTTGFSNLVTQQVTGERSGAVSNGISAASKLVQTGVKKLWIAATTTGGNTTTVSNNYRTGIIVGGNTTSVGLAANSTDDFYTTDQAFAKGNDSNTHADVLSIIIGGEATTGALTIGTLGADIEVKNVYTDFIAFGNNTANTKLTDVVLDGSNSGVGIVNSVSIGTAGSGYANDDALVFANGGITNGALPSLNAIGTVGTDGSGVITSVTLTGHGNGYYHAPTVTITTSGGSSGVLTPVMHFAYGLPKHGNTINTTKSGGYSNVINEVLKYNVNESLGSVLTFSSINGGNNYVAAPYALVQNRYIDKFNQRDANLIYDTFSSTNASSFDANKTIVQAQSQPELYINIASNTASFTIGEGVVQEFNSTVNNFGIVKTGNSSVIIIRNIKQRKVESGGAVNVAVTGHSVSWQTSNTFIGLSSNSYANVTGQANLSSNRYVKANVITSNTTTSSVHVRMHDSRFDFETNSQIHYEDYSSQANLTQWYYLTPSTTTQAAGVKLNERAGLNANVNVDSTTSTGLITGISLIQSGYGYEDGETVTMSGGSGAVISGAAVANSHGTAQGFHKNNRGFLNEDKYIHDNDFYQEYSYEVRSGLPLDKYERTLKEVVHVAGSKLFGRFQQTLTANMAMSIANNTVSQA